MKALGWISLALIAAAMLGLFVVQSLVAMNRPLDSSQLGNDARFNISVMMPAATASIPPVQTYEARDRSLIGYRHYRSKNASRIKLYLVHAETWDDLEFAPLATELAFNAGIADVFTFDMRGHGQNPLHRGDVNYIGQPTDDLADLIARTAKPEDVIIIGGHSMGAAVAARLALQPGSRKPAGLLLLSPVFSTSLPDYRPGLAGWLLPLQWRIAGLTVLNTIGIHWSDREVAAQFAVPNSVREGPLGYSVTTDYSWRLFKSLQLAGYGGGGLAGLKLPVLTVAGEDDVMIDTKALAGSIKQLGNSSQYASIPGENHFGLVNSEQTLAIIQNWLSKLR
jgi:pimeloyl-ACP methyl ester carboxylesterase